MQEAKPLVSTPGQGDQSRGSCAREACASSALGGSPACSGLGALQPRTPGPIRTHLSLRLNNALSLDSLELRRGPWALFSSVPFSRDRGRPMSRTQARASRRRF